MHHQLCPDQVCSPAMFGTCFSYDKDTWIAATDNYMYFEISVIFLLTATLNKFYSFIIFSLLINDVILLMNYLVLKLYLYKHIFFST